MGRAIVREPQAFLMDEPLSNLDAKLRVSMRAQLSRLHERLGVTTVYVTHDQIEAMTLGQRVAVLRGGRAAAVRHARGPLRAPREPLRGRVHRLTRDEPSSRRRSRTAKRASAPAASRSPPAPHLRGRIVLGIRPHDLKLGGSGVPASSRSFERSATETHVVVGIDAPRLRTRRAPPKPSTRPPDDDILLAEDDRASFTLVTEARAEIAVGDRVELTVDPSRLYGFDLETGEASAPRPRRPPRRSPPRSALKDERQLRRVGEGGRGSPSAAACRRPPRGSALVPGRPWSTVRGVRRGSWVSIRFALFELARRRGVVRDCPQGQVR